LVGFDRLGRIIEQGPRVVQTVITEEQQVPGIVTILTNDQEFRRDIGGIEQRHDMGPFR
jgi:hypothetical protein